MSTDSRGRPAWMQTMETCRHFTGMYKKQCAVGVAYDAVAVKDGEKRAWPCTVIFDDRLEGKDLSTCTLADYPTEAEAKAREAEIEARYRQWDADIAANVCPTCKEPITKRQVGRCVYGSCGHRLYQGRVPTAPQ